MDFGKYGRWYIRNKPPRKQCLLYFIHSLITGIIISADGTLQELSENLRKATAEMKKANCSTTSVQSGCELFQRFITLAALDQPVITVHLYI